MLNNTALTAETMAILAQETGWKTPADLAEWCEGALTDTREPFVNFRNWEGHWTELGGVKYFAGRIQTVKGEPRQTFLFIPQGDWNIVYIC